MIIMTRIMWLLLTIEWFIYWQLLDALINPSCMQSRSHRRGGGHGEKKKEDEEEEEAEEEEEEEEK